VQCIEDLVALTAAYLPGGGFQVFWTNTEQGQTVWALGQHN
jgi:hypothetical protein